MTDSKDITTRPLGQIDMSAKHEAHPSIACPACLKARDKYNRLDGRMARRGNFGIVPLPRQCKAHRLTARSTGGEKP